MVTNTISYNVYHKTCPSRQVLDIIANKWTALVIGQLADGPRRFSVLKRGIDGISQKMLTQTLRELERNGIVSRTIYAEVPPRVEYALTPLGQSLKKPMDAIRDWSEAHIEQINTAQHLYQQRSDV
ncbi:MAG: helix-turn-helix transcriptional regulator [Anaerolineaceae bacterium]|nr:helix-turn-helix transcriptional regulator [Anaerolineaceae bacterium]